jgi:hypothetical protein
MLYPITEFSYPQPYNQFSIPPGGLAVVPLVVAQGAIITVRMNQLAPDPHHLPQDQTIRCWLSSQQGGNPLPVDSVAWMLTALQRRIITVYDAFAGLGPFDNIAVDVPAGTYWLNALNLVSETNSFFLEIDMGA